MKPEPELIYRCESCGSEISRPTSHAGARSWCPACLCSHTIPGAADSPGDRRHARVRERILRSYVSGRESVGRERVKRPEPADAHWSRDDEEARLHAEKRKRLREYFERQQRERAAAARPESPAARHARTLGLSGKTTLSEIKRRYRELAAQCHPDRAFREGPDAIRQMEERFKRINEAYLYFKTEYKRR